MVGGGLGGSSRRGGKCREERVVCNRVGAGNGSMGGGGGGEEGDVGGGGEGMGGGEGEGKVGGSGSGGSGMG